MHNNKADVKLLPHWTDELQSKVQAAERQLECREGKRMELEDSSSQRRRAWEKLWEPGGFSPSPYLASLCSFFHGDSTRAISGINGALTKSQCALGTINSPETFAKDTVRGRAK